MWLIGQSCSSTSWLRLANRCDSIVVIRILIAPGRILMRTERVTSILRSDNLETRYLFFLSFQNGACFHGVAHKNTLRHNEVT